jgi:hypothetical protein
LFEKLRTTTIRAVLAVVVIALPPMASIPAANVTDPRDDPQQRQAAQAPRPTGSATITVTVVSDEDGTGVRRARVVLVGTAGNAPASSSPARTPGQAPVADVQPARDRGASPIAPREGRTTAGGVVTFTDLPAGDYGLSVLPPAGFIFRTGPSRIQVENGGQAKATVKLARGAVLTGRVVDEDGDPVTGASISVFRVPKSGGRPQSASRGGQQPTNDLGIYRLWGLAAGDYLVSASFQDRPTLTDEQGQDGYLPTYYPGVAAFDAARPVQVKAGQETGGVDIQLVRGRLGTVSGRVMDASGNYVGPSGTGASVLLSARGNNPAFEGRGAGVRQDGTFLVANVPAGEYYLSVSLSRGGGANASREGAYVPVAANGDEVSVTIQANLGATISGQVLFEGTPLSQAGVPGSPAAPSAARVILRTAASGQYATSFSAGSAPSNVVRPDGTFTVTGVRGPIQFSAAAARAALKSVTLGGRDISGQVLELHGTESIDDVVITMTYDTGEIQGVIAAGPGESLPEAIVVAYPDEPGKWNTGTPFVRSARLTGNGPGGSGARGAAPGVTTTTQPLPAGSASFQISGLVPGRYVVAAFADGSGVGNMDPQVLERWREFGKIVTVDAGQIATVKVTPVK